MYLYFNIYCTILFSKYIQSTRNDPTSSSTKATDKNIV